MFVYIQPVGKVANKLDKIIVKLRNPEEKVSFANSNTVVLDRIWLDRSE